MDQITTLIKGSETYLIVIAALILVFVFQLAGFLIKRSLEKILTKTRKTKNWWDDALIESLIRPARVGVSVLGIFLAIACIQLLAENEILATIVEHSTLVFWLLVTWAAWRMVSISERNITKNKKLRTDADKRNVTTVAAIAKLARFSLLIVLVLLVMQTFGVNITGLAAAGGIGGLAIGFAAKDLLANFFGGVLLYIEQPFKVGDWIKAPSHNIEGTVEDIGLRMTRLRTFDKRPLFVPNSIFTSIPVENPSRMANRRIYETVGVRYDDAKILPKIIEKVEKQLKSMSEIDQNQVIIVNLNAFAPSSMDFMVYCYTVTTDWIEYHAIKQQVLFMIMKTIEGLGGTIAYPTSVVHLTQQGNK